LLFRPVGMGFEPSPSAARVGSHVGLSDDQRDNDFVIEAHKRSEELRNRFRVEL
jgi:hypothetical protein